MRRDNLTSSGPISFTASICCYGHIIFIYDKYYYIQWLLLVFLVIFNASLPGSDDFVLFDLLDGNGDFVSAKNSVSVHTQQQLQSFQC